MKNIIFKCILALAIPAGALVFPSVVEARSKNEIAFNGKTLLGDDERLFFSSRGCKPNPGNWFWDNHGIFAEVGYFGGGLGLTSGAIVAVAYAESEGVYSSGNLDLKGLWHFGGYLGALPGVLTDWTLCKVTFGKFCTGRAYR